MLTREIRLGSEDRRKIFNVKNTTGIEHFYVICRWAFCLSLSSETKLKKINSSISSSDGTVEFTWDRFGGEESEIYHLLLLDEVKRLNLKEDDEALYDILISHIRRGLGYLTGNKELKSLEGLSTKVFKDKQLELIS